MKTNVVEKGQWERELEVEVPAERIEAEYTKACRRYQKRLEVPGFRKGKVPLNLVRRRFGDAIRSEVIQDLLPILMQEAAREAGVVPAAPPSIGKLEHEPGEALIFTAHVDIWPEIEVGNYDKLRVTRMVHEVTDQEIDDQLKEMQNRHATERSVDRPLEKGDVLIADLQRLDDGAVPIIGDKYEERYFIIGAGDAPSPEFEEATLGMRQGDERQVRFAYRDDLPNQELAGKQEFFSVTARDVRERQMPELDDDFAKDVGEQFETLEALRAHVAQSMARQWEFMGRQKLRGDLVAELMKQNPFELPDNIVDHYLQTIRESRERDGGGDPGPAAEPSDEEREGAMRQLKGHLLVETVRKQAGLEISDEEFDRYTEERAEERGVKVEDLKRSAQIDDLRRDLADDKVFEFLSEQARIEDEKV